jgi:small basic protein
VKLPHNTQTTLIYAGVSGAIVGVILWLLNEFAHVTVPDEVAAWLSIIVGVAVGFVTGGRANGGVTPAKK